MSGSREQQLEEENARLQQEIKLLQQKLDLLLRRQSGQSSEKVSPDQLDLLLNNPDDAGKPEDDGSKTEEETVVLRKTKKRKPGNAKKPRIPDRIPVESTQTITPQAVLDQPDQWRHIGQEVSVKWSPIRSQSFRSFIVEYSLDSSRCFAAALGRQGLWGTVD